MRYRTVLWIGNRDANEVRDAYETAEQCSFQLAYRPSLASAVDRPASDVDMIIVAAGDRAEISQSHLGELNRRHPSAKRMLLRSPLCSGVRLEGDSFFGDHRHNWLEAAEVLQQIIGSESAAPRSANCVAVIASNFGSAETLLQVAENAGCSAFWCRSESTLAVRGVDTVWWDDSFAIPTDAAGWTKRMTAMAACTNCKNTLAHVDHQRSPIDASSAGQRSRSRSRLTKPFPLELLSESLGSASNAKPTEHRLPEAA